MVIADVLENDVDRLRAAEARVLTITIDERIALSQAMSLKRIADALTILADIAKPRSHP